MSESESPAPSGIWTWEVILALLGLRKPKTVRPKCLAPRPQQREAEKMHLELAGLPEEADPAART